MNEFIEILKLSIKATGYLTVLIILLGIAAGATIGVIRFIKGARKK